MEPMNTLFECDPQTPVAARVSPGSLVHTPNGRLAVVQRLQPAEMPFPLDVWVEVSEWLDTGRAIRRYRLSTLS